MSTKQRNALIAAARARGWEGRSGGWVYNADGKAVCHGWSQLAKRTYIDWVHAALRSAA